METKKHNYEVDTYNQDPARAAQYQANGHNQQYYQDQEYAIQMQMQQQPYQQQNPYPQNQYGQQQNPYPQHVPQDLQNINDQNAEQEAEAAERASLNCIPALRGKTDRQNFVIKVYSIIFMMLGFTSAFTAGMVTDYWGDSEEIIMKRVWLYYFSIFMVIATMIAIVCNYNTFKKVPLNYISLAVYTFFHTYLVGACSTFYDQQTVLLAAVATMTMFATLTVYAVFTKTDITYYGGAMSSAFMMVCIFIIFMSFWRINNMTWTIVCLIMVVFMSLWIVYDTQIIVGGNKYSELSMDDYCIGALVIYSDIVTIFMYLMQLFGSS